MPAGRATEDELVAAPPSAPHGPLPGLFEKLLQPHLARDWHAQERFAAAQRNKGSPREGGGGRMGHHQPPWGCGGEPAKQPRPSQRRSLRCRPWPLFRPLGPSREAGTNFPVTSFSPGDAPHACCHTARSASTHPGSSSTRPLFATNCCAGVPPGTHDSRSAQAMAATTSWC
jgi:hypothetical protein